MPSEIERKFLLEQLPAELEESPAADIEQGYLAVAKSAEVRVRRHGEGFSLTLKRGAGEEREEIEIELERRQFEALWGATEGRRLTKRRYLVSLGDRVSAEVDVYFGALAGLRVAEVEFPSREAAASFQPPDWFGREVTGDRRYANQALAIGGIPSRVSGTDRSRAYALKEDEPFDDGLRRIAAGRAENALERLRGIAAGQITAAEAVHGARKDMKKLRTLLRLLREELPKKVYRQEAERYREAARKLSGSRDAEVKLATLDALAERADLPAEATGTWRRILDSDREAATGTVRGQEAMAEATALIEAGREGIERWRLEKDPWKAVGNSFTRLYRRGREGMRAAEADSGDDESFHEWRKRAKDLRYGLELLSGAWNGPLEATAAEADRLSELLGDHHDLAVLREDLRQRRLGEEETRRLEAAIEERQGELAAAAFDLGHRLYAERSKDLGRRLGRYWRAWRG